MARVLVVDDDPDVLNLVSFRLRKAQHKVIAVSGGLEALQVVAERGAPDVAVLDVAMPITTGFELMLALRRVEGLEDLPVIFLSGRVEPHHVEAGRALGGHYLTKPFSANALTKVIEKLAPVEAGW
jgi:two-component system, OmpR family, response regulator